MEGSTALVHRWGAGGLRGCVQVSGTHFDRVAARVGGNVPLLPVATSPQVGSFVAGALDAICVCVFGRDRGHVRPVGGQELCHHRQSDIPATLSSVRRTQLDRTEKREVGMGPSRLLALRAWLATAA